MTNEQIIQQVAIEIYGEEKVIEMLSNGIEIPLHTLQGWSVRGRNIKKGEHGIETKLWKKKQKKKHEEEKQESLATTNGDFYMCKAFLFKYSQTCEKTETNIST